jgi:arabinofuranan 3-O-arabinosyltransferase
MQVSLPWSDVSRTRVGSISVVRRGALPYVVAALAAALATQTWFRPGMFVATGDVGPFFRTNLSAELTTAWGHSLSSGGSASFQALARWPEILALHIASAMGASAPTAQRWFFTFIAVAAALGGVWFASAFARSPLARTAAGIVVVFNPFVLEHLPNPLTLWSIAMMGVAGGLVVRAARGGTRSPWWLAGLSVFGAYLAINPPLLAMVTIWTVGVAVAASWFVEPGASGRACRYLLRAAPWAVLLNLWWILPYGFALASQGTGYVVQAQTNVLAWSWTQVRLSPANVASLDGHWAWSFPEYFPYAQTIDESIWAPLRFGLPALAFAAPGLAVRDRRRPAIVLAVVVLLLLFLSKGLHAPLSGVNMFLYRQVPGMWLLREPLSKLGPMLVLLYAAMVALSLEGVHDLAGRSRGVARGALRTAVAVLAVGAVGFAYPMWTGQVVPDQRPILPSAHVQVPDGWLRLANTLNASAAGGKALVLPLDDFYQMPTTWGYYGVDNVPRALLARPTIQFLPGSYYGDLPTYATAVRSVQTALLNGDGAAVPPLLRSLGVSYVIVRRDLDADFPGRRVVPPDELVATLTASEGIQRDASYGVADLFSFESGAERKGADPLIRGGTAVNVTETDPNDVSYAVASAPSGYTVVSGTGETAGSSSTKTGSTSATVAGPTATTTGFSSVTGDLRLIPRLVAPQLVHLGEEHGDRGIDLVLDRATTMTVDGRPVLGGTLANIHLPKGSHVAAVASGAAFTPLVDGEALLGIGASGALSAWAAAGGLTWHGDWTGVRDCHDFDSRSSQRSGLSAHPLPGPAGGVGLTARSHAACVSSQASTGGSGTPLLLRFEYRTVDGRPARACLWTDDPGRCAPIPPLDPSPGWHRYAAVVPPGAADPTLFLYADGDAGNGVTTRTEYRGMKLERLSRVATRSVEISPPDQQTLSVEPGRHELVTQTRAPASLSPLPLAVEDCHAYDQRSTREADLNAVPLPGEPAPAVRLSALAHSACVSSQVAGFVPGGSYTLDLDYRTLRGLPARVCVWQDGPDRCAPMPALAASNDWYHLQAAVTPEPGTVALRLFIYADAGALGGSGTVVEYRALRIASAAPLALTILDGDGAPPAPRVSWTRLGPSTYQVKAARSVMPFVLSLGESFAPGWHLEGLPDGRQANHVVADGYANGWLIDAGAPFTATISFAPDRMMHVARSVSIGTALAIPIVAVRRRRRRA